MRTREFKQKIAEQKQLEFKRRNIEGMYSIGETSIVMSNNYKAIINWGATKLGSQEKKYTCECLKDIGLEELELQEELMLSRLCDAVVDLKVSAIEHNNIYINLI